MRIIGLTGGIASGKSTVTAVLEELGCVVIDADQLAREVVKPGQPALRQIVATFGAEILHEDGTLNRPALGQRVFSDPQARRQLEEITHPAIARLSEALIEEQRRKGKKAVFYSAPLIIEAGVLSRVTELWVVYVDRETQVERLMARDGIGRAEALRRIATQMPMEEKKGYGRIVFDNRGSVEELREQVVKVWREELEEKE